MCINGAVFFAPAFVSIVLIIWGISSKVLDWRDLKDRKIIIPEIGIGLLALSCVWMFNQVFYYEEINYLHLFAPALIALGITSLGVYRMRNDINFTGADYAYMGIILFFGSLFWIYWVFEAFT